MPKRVSIQGARGRWVAKVEGTWLGVIHASWRRGPTGYLDPMPGAKVDGKRYAELVEALRDHDKVVLQRDTDPISLARDGYVGVFHFKDLIVGADGSIGLTLTSRYADPKP